MSLTLFANPEIEARFAAAMLYLPRTGVVIATAVQEQNIGFTELANVCQAIGDDFGNALKLGVPAVTFQPHLKSMVFALHGSAVLANGQSAAWQLFSAGLSRMTMGVTPAAFYALALDLRANGG